MSSHMSSIEVFQRYIKSKIWAKNYDERVPPEVEIKPASIYIFR